MKGALESKSAVRNTTKKMLDFASSMDGRTWLQQTRERASY
jgi:hypothetical protein